MGWCPSLVDFCVRAVVQHPELCESTELVVLPPNLKDYIRKILLKRRAVSPDLLHSLLHPAVKEILLDDQVLTDAHLTVLGKHKHFQKVNLNQVVKPNVHAHPSQRHQTGSGCLSNAALVDFLQGQHALRTLFLRGMSDLNLSVFDALAGCKNLRHLDVGNCNEVEDQLVLLLSECEHLESLSLAGTAITDLALSYLSKSESRHSLTELRINKCPNITDDGIEILLSGLEVLEILIFHSCRQVTDRSRLALEQYLHQHRANVRQLTWTVY